MRTLNAPTPVTARRRHSLRIVGALAAKDIGDALRNRNTLSIVVMVLLMVVFYRYLPRIEGGDRRTVLLYDEGATQFAAELQGSPGLNLYEGYVSAEQMRRKVGGGQAPELGLALPADFDARLAAGETPTLQGYVAYWVGDEEAAALIADVETELALALGQPVEIALAPERAYGTLDDYGLSFLAGVSIIFLALMIGASLVPNLMLEEKKERTMEVLLVSPATPGQIVAGKALAGLFFIGVTLLVTLLLFAGLIVHWEIAVVAILAVSMGSVALGLLAGIWAETRQQLQIAVFVGAQPLLLPVFLSIMSDLLPGWLLALMSWIPTAAMATLFRAACIESPTLALLAQPLIVSVVSAAVLLALVLLAVRRQDR